MSRFRIIVLKFELRLFAWIRLDGTAWRIQPIAMRSVTIPTFLDTMNVKCGVQLRDWGSSNVALASSLVNEVESQGVSLCYYSSCHKSESGQSTRFLLLRSGRPVLGVTVEV